ncbi:MAG: D-alanine--D-alanine ligase [Chloroflexi bacterium]|nr:D-alanine--D-alanine ligase [Chloroflexota bacterium]
MRGSPVRVWAAAQSRREHRRLLLSLERTSVSHDKLRVGVLFGGRSGEHEVSLRSARSVMDAIDRDKYEVLPIGITKEGRWIAGGDPLAVLAAGSDGSTPAALIGAPGDPTLKAIEPAGLRDIAHLDVIFPVLHGPYGEDGTVQGLLELADIPYVGAGVVGSAVGMDKAIFKAVMTAHDIPVLPYRLVTRARVDSDLEAVLDAMEAAFTYPLFAKPANLGSSVGVSRAADRESLRAALQEAARYDRRILVEQGIAAREIEIAVLGNDDPLTSIPGEIVPGDVFYSYADKYINDAAGLLIPAPIPDDLAVHARDLARQAYLAVDCAGLARVDFLLDKGSGALWINEVNTIPGFTSISMYPKLWEATGIPYPELIDRLIQLALERHAEKSRNLTTYGE